MLQKTISVSLNEESKKAVEANREKIEEFFKKKNMSKSDFDSRYDNFEDWWRDFTLEIHVANENVKKSFREFFDTLKWEMRENELDSQQMEQMNIHRNRSLNRNKSNNLSPASANDTLPVQTEKSMNNILQRFFVSQRIVVEFDDDQGLMSSDDDE